MAGLYGFYNLPKTSLSKHFNRFFSSKFSPIKNEEFNSEKFIYGRSVLNKFNNDRFLFEDDSLIMGIEGIIYNAKIPKNDLVNEFREKGKKFFKDIEGQFSGFVFDKINNKIHLSTDTLSTKSIYYYFNPALKQFFFASELKVLTSLLNDIHASIHPDEDGFKCLLTLGYMLDDLTLVKEIRRLRNATILTFDISENDVKKSTYFDFNHLENKSNFEEIIDKIDSLLISSISKEWMKDKSETDTFFSFLSGGLDSRVNALLGKKLGYQKINVLNFSQTGAQDHLISKEIAIGESFNYHFFELDDGHYFLDSFEELVAANDGMVTVLGASHMYKALQCINLKPYGIAHSGQIGDVIFGSFSKPKFNLKENIGDLGYINDSKIIGEISILPHIIDRYKNSLELFSYEQRQVNGTLNGDRMCAHLIDIASPFYNRSLISFALSIPNEFKKNNRLYTEWIRNKHPFLFDYKWDKAGITPKNKLITNSAIYYSKVKKYVQKLFRIPSSSMNPFEYWYSNNSNLRLEIEDIYKQEFPNISNHNIRGNIDRVYTKFGPRGKFSAITAVLAYRLHFNQ